MWYGQWVVSQAKSVDELQRAHDILEWVAGAALPSGVLAEQLDPYTKAPLSVSPLTCSQASLVSLVHEYVRKRLARASAPPAPPATRRRSPRAAACWCARWRLTTRHF